MARDKRRCPRCGNDPGTWGYCRECGAILWYWIVASLMGGLACVLLGLETAYRAIYSFEPIFGGVVSFLGLLELGWVGWQLIEANRLRKKPRPPGPSESI